MTAPLTATVTRPEPPPEPVRPRLIAGVCKTLDGKGWVVSNSSVMEHCDQRPTYRLITIPTDAEAKAFAEYVAAMEELAAMPELACDPRLGGLVADIRSARATYEAERSKP
jgi:hypothetical protein